MGGPLKKYHVTMPSGVKTVMKLDGADAERLGGVPVDGKPEEAHQPREKAALEAPPAKKRSAPNKARASAENKGEGGGG